MTEGDRAGWWAVAYLLMVGAALAGLTLYNTSDLIKQYYRVD